MKSPGKRKRLRIAVWVSERTDTTIIEIRMSETLSAALMMQGGGGRGRGSLLRLEAQVAVGDP